VSQRHVPQCRPARAKAGGRCLKLLDSILDRTEHIHHVVEKLLNARKLLPHGLGHLGVADESAVVLDRQLLHLPFAAALVKSQCVWLSNKAVIG